MYLIDTLAFSLYDNHKIARCFDKDNAQKDIASNYNRVIYLFEYRNEKKPIYYQLQSVYLKNY